MESEFGGIDLGSEFDLGVTDDRGAKSTATKTVTVAAPNQAPSAVFTSSVSGLACPRLAWWACWQNTQRMSVLRCAASSILCTFMSGAQE